MERLLLLFSLSFLLFFFSCHSGKNEHIVVIDSGLILPKDSIITIDPMAITVNIESNSISVDFDHTTTELKDLAAFKKFIQKNDSRTNKKLTRIKCDDDAVVGRLDSVVKILTENHFEKMVLVK